MPKIDVKYAVKLVPQTKAMSCWAAASAMLLGWKSNIPYSELMAAKAAGSNFVIAFNNDQGVLSSEIVELAHALSLTTEAPQNFSAAGWENLLKKHGPLWVATAIFEDVYVVRHIRVVRGISGDGSSDKTELLVLDPAPLNVGREYKTTVTQFAKEIEEIARQDIGDDKNLLPQVLHF